MIHDISRKKVILLATSGAILVGLVLFISLFATHGRVVIVSPSNSSIESVFYCEVDCKNPTTTSNLSLFLATGRYSIQIATKDGDYFAEDVAVTGFSTKNVEVNTARYALSSQPSTYRETLPENDSVIEYDSDTGGYLTGVNSKLNVGGIVAAGYVATNKIALISATSPQKAYLYDTLTKSLSVLGELPNEVTATGENTYLAQRSLSVVTPGNQLETILITISSTGISTSIIPSDIIFDPSINSVVDGKAASIVRNDGQQTLYVYSLGVYKELQQITLPTNRDAREVHLSPDGTKAVVLFTERPSDVYDLVSGQSVMQIPTGGSVIWRDNSSFVYTTDADRNSLGLGALCLVNTADKTVSSIVSNKLLYIDTISAIVDNTVYFTALKKDPANTSAGRYALNLNSDKESMSKINQALLQKLPYDGMIYTLGYHVSKDQVLSVDVIAGQGSLNSAVQQMNSLGFDPGDYSISFLNYADPFVKSESKQ